VPDRPGLSMRTGNAGGLEITVDGAPAPSIGRIGMVRRNVALDAHALRTGSAVHN
jgi:cytoskeleton protein RodZ